MTDLVEHRDPYVPTALAMKAALVRIYAAADQKGMLKADLEDLREYVVHECRKALWGPMRRASNGSRANDE
jgi:hypothetical protein